MYTPQIYSGTNVHANMPYCETRMNDLWVLLQGAPFVLTKQCTGDSG